jgi:glycosyltransferase involved in cell wall biosynthesis
LEELVEYSKVTIGIPTLNRSKFLALAIESALEQTYSNIEIVVSNNASVDGTEALLASISDPRIKILHQAERLSMVDNWNLCLKAATGAYFLLLSDDDLLEPRAISEMLAAYERAAEPDQVGFVYCRGRYIDERGDVQRIGQKAPSIEGATDLILQFFGSRRDTWPCSILLRTSDTSEGYRPDLPLITDAAMWMKAAIRHGSAIFVDEELVNYRVHQNTTAATPIEVWQRENTNLATFAIETLINAGLNDPVLAQKIKKAASRLNTRIIPGLIRSSSRGNKAGTLKKYLKYWPHFVSLAGAEILIKSLLVCLLPQPILRSLRRLRSEV